MENNKVESFVLAWLRIYAFNLNIRKRRVFIKDSPVQMSDYYVYRDNLESHIIEHINKKLAESDCGFRYKRVSKSYINTIRKTQLFYNDSEPYQHE